jgi:uncharacterized membrane protein required for colicin V production
VYRFVSFFLALFLANLLYPHAARVLHATPLATSIRNWVSTQLNLQGMAREAEMGLEAAAYSAQRDFIDRLPLPGALRDMLHANNLPEMHGLLQVDTIDEYVSGFFANMAINAIAILLVFFIVMLLLTVAGYALDIVGMLPVIRTFNRAGGLIFGLALGAGLAWLGLVLLTLPFATGANPQMYELMRGSLFAQWVLDSVLPTLQNVR